MTVVSRVLALGCLILAVTAWTAAQAHSTAQKFPSEATVEGWLLSNDPRLVAWGARDVLVSRNAALTVDLLDLATQWLPLVRETAEGSPAQLSPEKVNKRDAMAAVLDAIIQMEVPLSGETIRMLAPDFPNPTAVLLSRMTPEEAEPLALDFYHSAVQGGYGLQYVSAAMLAQHPPSGFAADLLASIKVRADVFIVLPNSGVGFGGGSGGSCFMQSKPLRKNWPPIGQYSLSKERGKGSFLLVSGIDPIYATRHESDTYRDPCGGAALGSYERQRLIAEMLGGPADAIPWSIRLTPAIVFYSDEQFSHDLLQFIDEQEQKYHHTAIALGDRGLMTTAEVEQSAPKLEIYTNDMREGYARPMPTISPLPANVEWLNEPAWK